jgi:hypothetical protein
LIKRVKANIFNRFMANGRTSPVLITGIDGDIPTDYVVKLNGGMDLGSKGAVFEVTASILASELGISRPSPAIIFLSEDFIEIVAGIVPDKRAILQRSIGWNFGTELMKDIATWPVDAKIPASMIDMAADIFAFDALIQNPDRMFNNPNLVTQGDTIRIFDHECAFSFWNSIPRSSRAWDLSHGDYLEKHALRAGLRQANVNWSNVIGKIGSLTPSIFVQIRQSLPQDWNADILDEIEAHVMSVTSHLAEFELEIRRRIT